MYRYFNAQPPPNPYSYTSPFNTLVEDQNFIGWDNLFRGKFSICWNKIQRAYIKSSLSKQPNSYLKEYEHANAVTHIYTTIYNVLHDLWKQRCNDRHQSIDSRPSAFQYSVLEQDIRSLYDLRDQVLPDDRIAYRDDVEQHLGDSVRQLKDWLFRWRPVLLASVAKHARFAALNTKLLTTYFETPSGRPYRKPRISRRRTAYRTKTGRQTRLENSMPRLTISSIAKRKRRTENDPSRLNHTHPPPRIKIQKTMHEYLPESQTPDIYPDHPG